MIIHNWPRDTQCPNPSVIYLQCLRTFQGLGRWYGIHMFSPFCLSWRRLWLYWCPGLDIWWPCFSSRFKIQNSCFLDEQVTCSSRKPEFDCQQGHQMSDWSFPKVSVVFQEIDKQASGGLDCWILLVLDAGCHGLSPKRPVDHCLMLQPIFVNTFTLGFSTKKS